MRIGELAEQVGVSTDTVRFYERAGLLPRPPRMDNGYREYRPADVDHLRLLVDLRRMEIPLDAAARIAKEAYRSGKTVREIARAQNILPENRLKKILDPWRMTQPGTTLAGGGG